MKEDKYRAERSDRFEVVSIELNDIALLASYRKHNDLWWIQAHTR